ncbi:MAG: CinA family protein [Promethearchaeota archaeon]
MELLDRIENIIKYFTKENIKIAFAESCTGGYVANMFTNIPGASKVFDRGIVCYSNQAKIDLLNVNPKFIESQGAVSEDVVKQLAFNVRILSNVDLGIGISGIAGPTGGSPEKPVGTVYIGFSTFEGTEIQIYHFKTDRISFKKRVLEKVLEFLEKNFLYKGENK